MGLTITIRQHVATDITTGRVDTFDQFQILVGQRVVGYLGSGRECGPTLVARDLPEDVKKAIADACDKQHKRGKYAVAVAEGETAPDSQPVAVALPVTDDPEKKTKK